MFPVASQRNIYDFTFVYHLLIQANSYEDLGRWLGLLLVETGSQTTPETLHYDYVDVEKIANIINAVRHSYM